MSGFLSRSDVHLLKIIPGFNKINALTAECFQEGKNESLDHPIFRILYFSDMQTSTEYLSRTTNKDYAQRED